MNTGDILGYNLFAYCNNSCITHIDENGTVPNKMLMMADTGTRISNNCKAKIKIQQIKQAVCNSIGFEIGFGYGIGGGSEQECFESTAVLSADLVYINLHPNSVTLAQRYNAELSIATPFYSVGPRENTCNVLYTNDDKLKKVMDEEGVIFDNELYHDQMINKYGMQFYFIIGFTTDIYFDSGELINDLIDIIRS